MATMLAPVTTLLRPPRRRAGGTVGLTDDHRRPLHVVFPASASYSSILIIPTPTRPERQRAHVHLPCLVWVTVLRIPRQPGEENESSEWTVGQVRATSQDRTRRHQIATNEPRSYVGSLYSLYPSLHRTMYKVWYVF